MRALAHPVRLALVELLTVDGPRTATQAAERVGESPSNCSFHLRQLAKYGFVEEAGAGRGRQRPWRMRQIGNTIADTHADTETSLAADTLSEMFQSRMFDRWHSWRTQRKSYPKHWQDAAGTTESVWWVTVEELRELDTQLTELAKRYRERLTDPSKRPDGAEPVEFVSLIFPIRPPAQG